MLCNLWCKSNLTSIISRVSATAWQRASGIRRRRWRLWLAYPIMTSWRYVPYVVCVVCVALASVYMRVVELTIGGLYGGWTSRFSILSQSIRLKKAWSLTSRSPAGPHPNRFMGFFVSSCNRITTQLRYESYAAKANTGRFSNYSFRDTLCGLFKIFFFIYLLNTVTNFMDQFITQRHSVSGIKFIYPVARFLNAISWVQKV